MKDFAEEELIITKKKQQRSLQLGKTPITLTFRQLDISLNLYTGVFICALFSKKIKKKIDESDKCDLLFTRSFSNVLNYYTSSISIPSYFK